MTRSPEPCFVDNHFGPVQLRDEERWVCESCGVAFAPVWSKVRFAR
jgi:hypothetical protein